MSIEPDADFEPVFVLDTLRRYGFSNVFMPYVSAGNSVAYPLRNGRIDAAIMCVYFVKFGLVLSGHYKTSNSLCNIDARLPAAYESDEQALAMIVYSLRLKPENFMGNTYPLWYHIGLQNKELLPFVKQQAKFAARDHCFVSRTAFRPLIKEALKDSYPEPDEVITVSFDGAVLSFNGFSRELRIVADGKKWTRDYHVLRTDFENNPKRYISDWVTIDIWEGFLRINSTRIGALL